MTSLAVRKFRFASFGFHILHYLAPRYFGEEHVPVRYSRDICFVPAPESKDSLGFVASNLQACGDLIVLNCFGNPCCKLKYAIKLQVTGKLWHFKISKLFVCAVAMCSP